MYGSMVRYRFLSYVTLREGGKQALGSDVGRRYRPRPYWPQTMTISVTRSVGLCMRPSKLTWSPRVQRLFITVHRHFSPMTVWTQGPRHFGTNAEVPVRQFGTSAKLSRHIGTSAEMCCGHFGHKGRHLGPRQQWARQCQPSTSLIIWNGWCDIDHRHGGQVAE